MGIYRLILKYLYPSFIDSGKSVLSKCNKTVVESAELPLELSLVLTLKRLTAFTFSSSNARRMSLVVMSNETPYMTPLTPGGFLWCALIGMDILCPSVKLLVFISV